MSYRKIPTALFAIVLLPGLWFSFVVAASAERPAVQVQGVFVEESRTDVPNPDCGLWPAAGEAFVTVTGIDTLGGSFLNVETHCWARIDANSFRIFDYRGTWSYLQTGEEATIEADEWIDVIDREACVNRPAKPIKATIYNFTGEHAGGRLKGHFNYVGKARPCPSDDPRVIAWFEGVFTPNAPDCGLGFELALLLPVVIWLRRRRSLRS